MVALDSIPTRRRQFFFDSGYGKKKQTDVAKFRISSDEWTMPSSIDSFVDATAVMRAWELHQDGFDWEAICHYSFVMKYPALFGISKAFCMHSPFDERPRFFKILDCRRRRQPPAASYAKISFITTDSIGKRFSTTVLLWIILHYSAYPRNFCTFDKTTTIVQNPRLSPSTTTPGSVAAISTTIVFRSRHLQQCSIRVISNGV